MKMYALYLIYMKIKNRRKLDDRDIIRKTHNDNTSGNPFVKKNKKTIKMIKFKAILFR